MSLLKPRATKKVSYFAALFGVSVKTIKRIAKRQGWQEIKYSDGPTAPTFLLEQPVNEYFAKRQEEQQ
jgi:hypothetical protein